MAGRFPGLYLDGNTWYVRVAVPKDVQAKLGRSERHVSLKTGDRRDAERFYPHAPLDRHAAEVALGKWSAMITSNPERYVIPTATHLDTSPQMRTMIEGYRAFWESGDRSVLPDESIHDLGPLPDMTRQMLQIGGLRVAPGHPIIGEMEQTAAYHISLAYTVLERERRAMAIKSMPLEAVMPTRTDPKVGEAPAIKLSALYAAWKASLTGKKAVADKEKGRLDHQFRRLVETVGDLPANYVTKAMITEHMGLVARFPGRKRSAALNALPMRELVEQFEAENAKRADAERHAALTAFTAAEWFSGYRRMFAFGRRHDLLTLNPTDDIADDVVRGSKSTIRRAFTKEEIEKLFGTPLFRGYDPSAVKEQRNTAGSVVTRDSKYWIPIIALLHGARLTEMAAMPLADFRQTEDGDWFFDLTKRDVKTLTSRRLIPAHPDLVDLGFLEHVETLREAGEKWLFPDLNHTSKMGPGHGFSKWFGRWTDQIGLTDPTITFHSFRHLWVRRARETPGVKKTIHDIISGHKGQTVSDDYGPGADIKPLIQAMALITFPELTLTKLAA
jgi:integrase